MNIDQAFPSTWLKNSDLNGRAVRLTMKEVVLEEVGDDHKPVLYFQGAKKGLVLNKINSASIASAYGQETDGWNGKTIEVYPDMTIFGGKPTPCIRVRPVAAPAPVPPAAPAATPPQYQTNNQLDDSIPF
jgi:hypothetical protein